MDEHAIEGAAQAIPTSPRATGGPPRGVRAALLAMLLVWSWALARPAAADTPPTIATVRPPMIVVRALGPMDPEDTRHACRSLLEAFPVRCQVGDPRPLVEVFAYWNHDRRQLDARGTLEHLFTSDRDPQALIELDLTHLDIYEGDKPFVFGLASLTDRVAIVSLARIHAPTERLEHRLTKLVRHEVAHTLGLHHHNLSGCVMRQDPTLESLDQAPTTPCPVCQPQLTAQLQALARPGQRLLDQTRGHLVRGDRLAARRGVVATLQAGHQDLQLYEDFASAFLDGGGYDEAIALLRYVLRRDPQRAQAQLKLAWAFQERGLEGDQQRALEQLEGVLVLRPDWTRLQAHLATLRAQGPGTPSLANVRRPSPASPHR